LAKIAGQAVYSYSINQRLCAG